MGLNKRLFIPQGAGEVVNTGNFDIVTYSGNSGTRSITSLGFQPDLVWIKGTTANYYHILVDSITGANKQLYSNTTDPQQSDANFMTAFGSNGFTVGSAATTNNSGQSYVAWCWKAGGAAVSGTSTFFTNTEISANPSAGFSIVNFTIPSGAWSTDASYNHGLNSAPKLVITKPYSGAAGSASWFTYSEAVGTSKYLKLNSTDGETSGAIFSTVDATKVKYRFASSYGSSSKVITYNFADIDGYQKIGSYTGSSSGGKSVTGLGFQPRYVMIKRTNSDGGSWMIFDSERGVLRPLRAQKVDQQNVESSTLSSFDSDGFTLAGQQGGVNLSGQTYTYLAIA